MMTSTLSTPQQQTDGRTVREIVENNQEMVNEPWCRRIFRQVLQSLELQYTMQMPHRPITPDTVLVLDSGDPMLLPTAGTAPGDTEAQDVHDLAQVIHYAITLEREPAAPLRGRTLGDYSDSFVTAVDRCLSPDPAERPQTIEQLRNLLGIVVLGPAVPAQPSMKSTVEATFAQFADLPAANAPPEEPVAARGQPMRLQRWLLLTLAATVLLGGLAALVALLHETNTGDALVLALPQDEGEADAAAPALAPSPGAAAGQAAPGYAAAPGASSPGAPTPGAGIVVTPAPAAPSQPAPDQPAPPTSVTVLPAAALPGATYKLVVKPWGTILVNGVNRGVSPPLKRLTLPAGQHTIRIINPSFPEHTVTVNSVKGETAVIELDFTEEEME
ncbi:hypothetical protein B0920_02265 [Massilia sp. KIM]|uniref:hypothetical protein n=1 Tax=Massilia sp. KIM TaxID=1955422 RepID=UPI00098EDC1B|nr:hypothetical protein [Massilia sp. KIM]OON62322.1 hypothetical protein B0920_02265 [Massilia sp. KIM]